MLEPGQGSGQPIVKMVINNDTCTSIVLSWGNSVPADYYTSMFISNGGSAFFTGISSGCIQTIKGGTMKEGVFNYSAGTATITDIYSGGFQELDGGHAYYTNIHHGGRQNIMYGSVSSTIVSAGGKQNIGDVASAERPESGSGASLTISGYAFSTLVLGGTQTLYNSGSANLTVLSSAYQYISSGGKANGTTVSSGGLQMIYEGGIADSNFICSAGVQNISSGGCSFNTFVSSGARQNVSSGGIARNVVISSGGTQYIGNGGTAYGNKIAENGTQYVNSGGLAGDTLVSNGGLQYISSGGSANVTIIHGGEVAGDGIIDEIIINYGSHTVSGHTETAIINGTIITDNDGVLIFSSTGIQSVYSGGSVTYAVINKGGSQTVEIGGHVSYLTVTDGGIQSVYGATIDTAMLTGHTVPGKQYVYNNALVKEAALWGGAQYLYGGKVNNAYIADNGIQYIYFGGTVSNAVIGALGTQFLSGGTLGNVSVKYGGNLYLSGGFLTGEFSVGGQIHTGSGISNSINNLNFVLNDVSQNQNYYLIDNLAVLDVDHFSISAGENLTTGIYKLAAGAADFSSSIKLLVNGIYASDLEIGQSFAYQNRQYTLNLDTSNQLTLTVNAYYGYSYHNNNPGDTIVADTVEPQGNAANNHPDFPLGSPRDFSVAGGISWDDPTSSGMIISSGTVNVNSGETMVDSWLNGTSAVMNVNTGGAVSNTTVLAGNLHIVGGVAYDTVMSNYGGTVHVSSGGTIFNPIITSGHFYISSGGVAASSIVGYCDVYMCGGTMYDTVLASGDQRFASGGVAYNTTINAGGHQWLWDTVFSSKVFAINTIINSGGIQTVDELGWAVNTIINSGGEQSVNTGTASNTTINSGGVQIVDPAGGVIDTTIAGGTQKLGCIGYGNTIINNGVQSVRYGGTAINNIIAGGTQEILDGSADNTIIGFSGLQSLKSDISHSNDTVINFGGMQEVGHVETYAYNTIINDGGYQKVASGGLASNTEINSGGRQDIFGIWDNDYTWLNSEYILNYECGTSDTAIQSGGVQNIYSRGKAITNIIKGGTQNIYDGGTANHTIVSSDGNVFVHSGGNGSGITQFSGGNANVTVYGNDSKTKVTGSNANGSFYLSNGVASNFIIYSGGVQNVSSGGSAFGTIVYSGGVQNILSRGYASDVTISSGGSQYVSGGTAYNVNIYGGTQTLSASVKSGALISAGTVSNGIQNVFSGGRVYGMTLLGSSLQTVDGGVDYCMFSSGASQIIYSGGAYANGFKAGAAQILYGGYALTNIVEGIQYVSGGSVRETHLRSAGLQYLCDGTWANSCTISSGTQHVYSGGSATNNMVLGGGTISAYAGAVIGGVTTIGGIMRTGGEIDVQDGSIVFNLTVRTTSGPVIIDNLVNLNNVASYGVSIGAAQIGIYSLAGGAEGFFGNASLTVGGVAVGSLSGSILTYGSKYYLLWNFSGNLALQAGTASALSQVNTANDLVNITDSQCSFREAVELYAPLALVGGTATVTFAPLLNGGTIAFDSIGLVTNTVISGNGVGNTILAGDIYGNGQGLRIDGINLASGAAYGGGSGGSAGNIELEIAGGLFASNVFGGGVNETALSINLLVNGGQFTNLYGGGKVDGQSHDFGQITFDFAGGTANRLIGGAVAYNGGTVNIEETHLNVNGAVTPGTSGLDPWNYGGGIVVTLSIMNIATTNITIDAGDASVGNFIGGGRAEMSGRVTTDEVVISILSGDVAAVACGGYVNKGGTATVGDTSISMGLGASAVTVLGGGYLYGGSGGLVEVTNTSMSIAGNISNALFGGSYLQSGNGLVEYVSIDLSADSAVGVYAGGYAVGGSDLVKESNILIHDTTLSGPIFGGGYSKGGTSRVDSSTITIGENVVLNNSIYAGGFCREGTVSVGSCTIIFTDAVDFSKTVYAGGYGTNSSVQSSYLKFDGYASAFNGTLNGNFTKITITGDSSITFNSSFSFNSGLVNIESGAYDADFDNMLFDMGQDVDISNFRLNDSGLTQAANQNGYNLVWDTVGKDMYMVGSNLLDNYQGSRYMIYSVA